MGKGCVQDVIGPPLKDAFQTFLPSVQSLQVAAADISLQTFKSPSKLPTRHSPHQPRVANKEGCCRAELGTSAKKQLLRPLLQTQAPLPHNRADVDSRPLPLLHGHTICHPLQLAAMPATSRCTTASVRSTSLLLSIQVQHSGPRGTDMLKVIKGPIDQLIQEPFRHC